MTDFHAEDRELEPITFDEIKSATAADLRVVAAELEKRAKAVEQGDLAVMDDLLDDKWSLWHQMLLLRLAHREERPRVL